MRPESSRELQHTLSNRELSNKKAVYAALNSGDKSGGLNRSIIVLFTPHLYGQVQYKVVNLHA